MAADQPKYVTIYKNSASNLVPDYELPYWESPAGGSWSLTNTGTQAQEEIEANGPKDNTPVTDSAGNVIQPIPGPEFNKRPKPPFGTPQQRSDEGRYSLVYFTDDPTPGVPETGKSYWLFDSEAGGYHPISDYTQLEAFLAAKGADEKGQEALRFAIELDPASVKDPSLGWEGTFLGLDHSPTADGTLPTWAGAKKIPSLAISEKYGATKRNQEDETRRQREIRDLVSIMVQTGNLAESTLDRIEDNSDPLLAEYVSAVVYGKYSFGEIWQDLKAKELAETDPSYANVRAIDPKRKRNEFVASSDYDAILNDPTLSAKPVDALMDGEYFMNTPMGSINDDFYDELTPTFDWTDPQYRDQLDDILAEWYDLSLVQNNADTEQAKAIADDNFNVFLNRLNKNYGLKLSNNARQAWGQLQQLTETAQAGGLQGSGIHQEAQDRHLSDIRRADQFAREDKLDEKNAALRGHLLNNANEDEINDAVVLMDSEDAAAGLSPDQYRSARWGLYPSDETAAFYDDENLKKRFPNLTDKERELLRGQNIDKHGRRRSGLYRQGIGNELEIRRSRDTFKQQELETQKAQEDARRRAQHDPQDISSYVTPDQGKHESLRGPEETQGIKVPTDTPVEAPAEKVRTALDNPNIPEGFEVGADDKFRRSTSTFQMPEGYEKIDGARYEHESDQKGAYEDIQQSEDKSYLYGKKRK